MPYIVYPNNTGCRWVDASENYQLQQGEKFSDIEPVITALAHPDIAGFVQSIKNSVGGILAANALVVAYPLFFDTIEGQFFDDAQIIILDAKAKSIISAAQYKAIKAAATQFNIPIIL